MSPYIACTLIGLVMGAAGAWRVQDWRYDAKQAEALREAHRMNNKRESISAKADQAAAKELARHHVVTQTIFREVVRYVPLDSPSVPGGFRVLHDAAALGDIPDAARIPDAASTPLADVAIAVVDNYAACHDNAIRLEALQRWVRAQSKVK
jgi:hypothetical protein